jgi:hypothetical protein
MANHTRHNPEATSWHGKSHKKGGARIAELRMEQRFDSKAAQKLYEEELVAEVRRALNAFYYGDN